MSYLLLAQLTFSIGLKAYVVIDWKINQDYITEKYCENKDKPMLNCNGSCHLAKQLEQLELQEEEERKDFPNPQQKIEKVDFVWHLNPSVCAFTLEDDIETHFRGATNKTMISQPHLSMVVPPPQV